MKNLLIIFNVLLSVLCLCPNKEPGLTLWSSIPSFNSPNSKITISSNQKILVDITPPALHSLTIDGTLIFDNKNINMEVGWIRVNPQGKFIMGSSEKDCAIDHDITITITGKITGASELGIDSSINAGLGDRGIALYSGSTFELFGKLALKSWTFLSKTAFNGTTQLVLKDVVDWKKGDKIVITNTDFSYVIDHRAPLSPSVRWQRGFEFPEQNEEREVVSVLGNIVTIDKPLTYTHWSGKYYSGEVALLTRYIKIQGDSESTTTNIGGHVLVRNTLSTKIQGVEFTRMGQLGIVGRYPLHFHLAGDLTGKFVKDCSFHHTFQRAIAIHDSNSLLVENVVGYDSLGHMFFLEDGSERKNVFKKTIGILVRPISSESGKQIIPTDNIPSIFWISNPDNEFDGCVSVGGKFGFWYVMPVAPTGIASKTYGSQHEEVRPRWTPLGKFENNIAHSAVEHGLMIDQFVDANGNVESASYAPYLPPYAPNVQEFQLTPAVGILRNFVAYKNRDHGSWVRARNLVYDNFLLVDNRVGHNGVIGGRNIIQNSVIVAESDNLGLAHRRNSDLGGRSRPAMWERTNIKGLDTYDNGGPQYARNVTFINFNEDFKVCGALGNLDFGPFIHHSRNIYTQLKFINTTQRTRITNHPGSGDVAFGVAILDGDGSVTGIKGGGWILSRNPLLVGDNTCIDKPSENSFYCPPILESFVQVTLEDKKFQETSFIAQNGTNLSSLKVNDIPNNARRITFFELGKNFQFSYYGKSSRCTTDCATMRYVANIKSRKQFTVRWVGNVETPKSLSVRLSSDSFNEWLILAIPYPALTNFSVKYDTFDNKRFVDMLPVNSFRELNFDNYFFDRVTNHLYLKLQNIFSGSVKYNQIWDYDDYISDGRKIHVDATCPSGKCTGSNYAIPRESPITFEQRLEGTFNPCSGVNSSKYGKLFATFNPGEKYLNVIIYHDALNVNAVEIFENSRRILVNVPKFSPIRLSIPLSYNEWTSLVKGGINLKIKTTNFPNGELCASIRSKTCNLAVPPAIPIIDPCNFNVQRHIVFNETVQRWPGWDNSKWGDTNFTITNEAKVCGVNSMKVEMKSGGFTFFHHRSTRLPIPAINSTTFKFLEMWILSLNGNLPLNIRIMGSNSFSSSYRLTSDDIATYKIDESGWARVVIPLTKFKFAPLQEVTSIQFSLDHRSPEHTFYIDNLQFISAIRNREPFTVRLANKDIAMFDGKDCSATTLELDDDTLEYED